MSAASQAFAISILDAENLLKHFDELNKGPPPADIEVLKRAGLIMAIATWETYVEDRVQEAAAIRFEKVSEKSIVDFMRERLKEEISRLHNPMAAKTTELFRNYAGIDLTGKWAWNGCDDTKARDRLDHYIRVRGDIAHRSRGITTGPPQRHAVQRDELEKAISFLKLIVEATEKTCSSPGVPRARRKCLLRRRA